MNTHKSVRYQESICEVPDLYEEPDFRPGVHQWEQSAPLIKKQGVYRSQIRRVSAKARDGCDCMDYILHQSGAETQYRLLMQKAKVLGLDRPCIRTYTYLSKQQKKELVEQYTRGATIKELKDKFKVKDSAIYRITKDITRDIYPVYFPKSSFTKEQLSTMLQLYNKGETASAISRVLNRNSRGIRKIIVKRTNKNLTERTHIPVSEEEALSMRELYKNGKGVTAIGKLYKRSATTVRNVVDPGNEKPRVNFTETEIADLKVEFSKGSSIVDCSKKFNRCYNAIKYRFKQFEKK